MSRYLAVGETAKLLGVSEKFIYRHQGELPGMFKIAGRIFFDEKLLTEGLEKLARKPVKPVLEGSASKHGL